MISSSSGDSGVAIALAQSSAMCSSSVLGRPGAKDSPLPELISHYQMLLHFSDTEHTVIAWISTLTSHLKNHTIG